MSEDTWIRYCDAVHKLRRLQAGDIQAQRRRKLSDPKCSHPSSMDAALPPARAPGGRLEG